MYIYAFSVDESDRVFAQTDPEVLKAIDAMPKAKALAQGARKVIVQRMTGQDRNRSATRQPDPRHEC